MGFIPSPSASPHDSISSSIIGIPFPKKSTIVIGISGVSSSGKTALSTLLATIFNPSTSTPNLETTINLAKTDDPEYATFALSNPVTVLHQDDYFFRDKSIGPVIQYWSSETDDKFMKKSAAAIADNWRQGIQPLYRVEAPIVGDTQKKYKVTGPDTDCDEAIRFTALLEDIKRVQRGDKPLHSRIGGGGKNPGQDFELDIQASGKNNLEDEHFELIREMRSKVQSLFQQREGSVRFCFVDGFLLFNDPNTEDYCPGGYTGDELEDLAQEKIERFEQLTAQLHRGNLDLDAELEYIKGELHLQSYIAKEIMQSEFDIKLFLPTSKEACKQRRFLRRIYIDYPEGGRLPGQMWKSEGYFDSIVWKNFAEAHEWLTRDSSCSPDIAIRPVEDAGMDFTVRWAVNAILVKLGYTVSDL